MIYRAYIEFANKEELSVTSGYGECNGNYWENSQDITIGRNNLSGMLYVYVDSDKSDFPIPTFIVKDVSPVYSALRLGWYDTNDRCIGAVYAPGGSIKPFTNVGTVILWTIPIDIATNMTPDGTYNGEHS